MQNVQKICKSPIYILFLKVSLILHILHITLKKPSKTEHSRAFPLIRFSLADARRNRSEAVTIATKEQMKTEFAYFGEAWNFFKKFYETSGADEYWDAVVQEAGSIVQKYDDCPLCKAVVLAIIDELERKCQAREGA